MSVLSDSAATIRGGAIAIRGSTLILAETDISNNTAQWGATMSACNSAVYTNEMKLPVMRNPVPVYAHCFISDGAAETFEEVESSTISAMVNFTINYDYSVGVDTQVTDYTESDGQRVDLCNMHPKTGYIVVVATLTTTAVILIGCIVINKVYSKRQTCSSFVGNQLMLNEKCTRRKQPHVMEMQPSEKKMDLAT